jgi:hypothetical protein
MTTKKIEAWDELTPSEKRRLKESGLEEQLLNLIKNRENEIIQENEALR